MADDIEAHSLAEMIKAARGHLDAAFSATTIARFEREMLAARLGLNRAAQVCGSIVAECSTSGQWRTKRGAALAWLDEIERLKAADEALEPVRRWLAETVSIAGREQSVH